MPIDLSYRIYIADCRFQEGRGQQTGNSDYPLSQISEPFADGPEITLTPRKKDFINTIGT